MPLQPDPAPPLSPAKGLRRVPPWVWAVMTLIFGLWLGWSVGCAWQRLSDLRLFDKRPGSPSLREVWGDFRAPLTDELLTNMPDERMYVYCAQGLGFSQYPGRRFFAHKAKPHPSRNGWLWQDTLLIQNGQAVKLPFICEVSGYSLSSLKVNTIILQDRPRQ